MHVTTTLATLDNPPEDEEKEVTVLSEHPDIEEEEEIVEEVCNLVVGTDRIRKYWSMIG